MRGLCVACRRELFLKFTTDGAIDHSGGNERQLLETDRDQVPVCVKCLQGMLLLLHRSWLCIVCVRVWNSFLLTALQKHSQKVPYIHKGFNVCSSLESNPRHPAWQPHALATLYIDTTHQI